MGIIFKLYFHYKFLIYDFNEIDHEDFALSTQSMQMVTWHRSSFSNYSLFILPQ